MRPTSPCRVPRRWLPYGPEIDWLAWGVSQDTEMFAPYDSRAARLRGALVTAIIQMCQSPVPMDGLRAGRGEGLACYWPSIPLSIGDRVPCHLKRSRIFC